MKKERVKKLLVKALENAIDWEQSLLDAGAFMEDKEGIRRCNRDIKAFKKLVDNIAPNRPMTLKEYLKTIPDDSFMSVDELIQHSNEIEDGASK